MEVKLGKRNESKVLPWWVELLFVQIGLPDNWLRSLLRNRKKARIIIIENKQIINYSLLIVISMFYLHPIVKKASLHNNCVINSIGYVTDSLGTQNVLTKNEIRSVAISFCNGGKI